METLSSLIAACLSVPATAHRIDEMVDLMVPAFKENLVFAVELLLTSSSIDGREGELRFAAMQSLGYAGDNEAKDNFAYHLRRGIIEAGLFDQDPDVRDAAASSLYDLDDQHSIAALHDALRREDVSYVRDTIKDTLDYVMRDHDTL